MLRSFIGMLRVMRLKAMGAAIIGLTSGIGVGVSASWLWTYHTRPNVSMQLAMGVQEWSQEIRGDSAYLHATLYDRYTGELAVRLSSVVHRSFVGPYSGEREAVIKILVRNSGRTAATNVRIPVYVNKPGRAWIEFSPHVEAELTYNPDHRLAYRSDAIRVRSLPPRTRAIITYHFEIDAQVWERADDQPLEWSIRKPFTDEVPHQDIQLVDVPLGQIAVQENNIGMLGRPVLVQRFRPSGAGGSLVACVDSADAFYRQITIGCGGRRAGDR